MYWRAKYINGATVTEDDGVSTDFLNRAMLAELSVMDNGLPIHTIFLDPSKKHFYRRRVSLKPGVRGESVHILGYRQGNDWHIAVVHEDKKIEFYTEFDKTHNYLYPPKFLPHEEMV